MTITELPVSQTPAPSRCELLWDLPNQTTTLFEINGKPGSGPKLDFAALGQWVTGHAGAGDEAAATVFANVTTDKNVSGLQGFINAIRNLGFSVFAKPRVGDSDIDDDLVAHVESVSGSLAHLIVGTHDRGLLQRCLDAVPAGCRVTVIGFEECSNWARSSDRVEFVDLEDIPGLFLAPLGRCLLRRLPAEGALLPALAPLPRGIQEVANAA